MTGQGADVGRGAASVPVPPRPGSVSDWRRLRMRGRVSVRTLASLAGLDVERVDLIDRGELVALPSDRARLLSVLRPEHPGTVDVPPLASPPRGAP